MNIKFKDGSSLFGGDDSFDPFLRFRIGLLGIPVEAVEKSAAAQFLETGKVVSRSFDCMLGFVAYHAGHPKDSENGWQVCLADRPGSLAAREAASLWQMFKADQDKAGTRIEVEHGYDH